MMYVLRKIQSFQLLQQIRTFDYLHYFRSVAAIRIPESRGAHLLYALAISLSILGIYNGAETYSATARAIEAAALPASSIESLGKPKNLEVHIAGNGLTTLRGGRIASISKREIQVISAWGSAEFVWKVELSSKTRFTAGNGERAAAEDLKRGDYVTITGMLDTGAGSPTINATYVRLSRS